MDVFALLPYLKFLKISKYRLAITGLVIHCRPRFNVSTNSRINVSPN